MCKFSPLTASDCSENGQNAVAVPKANNNNNKWSNNMLHKTQLTSCFLVVAFVVNKQCAAWVFILSDKNFIQIPVDTSIVLIELK